jgi:VWFA-related protein
MSLRRIAFVVFVLFLATASFAASHRETTTVEVVQVPVYVSRNGEALKGLGRGDFELFVNGKRQQVEYFDVIDFAGLPAEAAKDPRQRRLYLFTFDLLFSSLNAVERAQKAAQAYVDRALPGDVFAVARYSSNHGLEFIVPFTRDRALVHSALRSLSTSYAADPLQLTLSATARPSLNEVERYDMPGNSRDLNSTYTVQQAARDAATQPFRFLVEDEVVALTEIADRMAQMEGQKHVVLFSGGFDTGIFTGIDSQHPQYNSVSNGPQAGFNPYGTSSTLGVLGPQSQISAGEPHFGGLLRGLSKHYTTAGVFLDAIDVAGLRPAQTATDNESLFTLTGDTGGTVIEHENDLGKAIQELTDQQRVVYLLGFKPSGSKSRNSIRVNVRNADGADVTYRPSYSNEIPLPSSNDALRLADILANDIPQTGIPVTAATAATPGHVAVDVDIATRELLALSEGKNVDAEALIYVYSGNSVVSFQQKHITLDAGKVDPSKSVRISQTFELPNGSYAAKVLVRFDDQLGFARSDFAVGQ